MEYSNKLANIFNKYIPDNSNFFLFDDLKFSNCDFPTVEEELPVCDEVQTAFEMAEEDLLFHNLLNQIDFNKIDENNINDEINTSFDTQNSEHLNNKRSFNEIENVNQWGGNNFFDIVLRSERINQKFQTRNVAYRLKFKNLPTDLFQLNQILINAINSFLFQLKIENPNDHVKFMMMHDNLDNPIQTAVLPWRKMNSTIIFDTIEQTVQSNRALAINENMFLYLTIIKEITGAANDRIIDYLQEKPRTFSRLLNNDKMCLQRAVLLGQKLADKQYFKKSSGTKCSQYQDICKDLKTYNQNPNRLTNDAYELSINAIIDIDNECSLIDVQRIEKYLKDYQICVLSASSLEWIYEGARRDKVINLMHIEIETDKFVIRHFELIKSLPSAFNKRHYCSICKKGYHNFNNHPCNNVCKLCDNKECRLVKNKLIECSKCHSKCNGQKCLETHCDKKCNDFSYCENCKQYKTKIHVCSDERWCHNCNKAVEMNHYCFILTHAEREAKKKQKKESKFAGYIFFDYECMVINNEHFPNLVIADKSCIKCIDQWSFLNGGHLKECKDTCGIFKFKKNKDFCDWLLKQKHYVCVAHNLKGYDGAFILQYLISNPLPNDKYDIITQGLKVNFIKFNSIKIIDSLNFIPSSLAKFPKTFGLKELKKGYFPHKFNLPENHGYNQAPLPSIEYYGTEYMNEKDKKEFLKWYNENKDKNFNFEEEIESYCKSDVNILKLGCLSFRDSFMQLTGSKIDPFRDCCTLASLCQKTFRTLFMKNQSMALINENGFNPTNQYSKKQIEWIQYTAEKEGVQIRHCLNGREFKIGKYKVDGYCEENRTVYEFHGCWFHGCVKCFKEKTFNPMKKQTMEQLRRKTQQKAQFIINEKYNYIEIWEHEWDELVKSNKEINNFVSNSSISIHLKPRDALFGGRTNAAKLHHMCNEGEQIKYYDFTSLYPYVQKNCIFPYGLPTVITTNFQDISLYFGLIKCTILPPNNLLYPVLPAKINGKLIFTLCKLCAEIKSKTCTHTVKEKVLTGTWVTEEVKLAISEGYCIKQIFSIWHWSENDRNRGLFADYVNTFLKAKQENSGFPSWCTDETQKIKYISDYEKHENISLDLKNIEYNEGKRTISKLMLNSLWGRYAMQTNKPKTAIVKSRQELLNYLRNDLYEVKDVNFYKEVCHINYIDKDFIHQGNKDANIALGCFVTAYGRMKLYKEMKKIGENLLYFDTDSLLFISKPEAYLPELGDYLGDFTSELDSGEFIEEFVSAGPKNYGYKTNKGKEIIKVKGFSLSSSASQQINYQNVLNLVKNQTSDTLNVNQLKFKRNKKDWSITTEDQIKKYKQVYDKRILLDDLTTLPYGFKNL